MKILKHNIENFIENITKQSVNGVLLYGNDVGVIAAREDKIKNQFKNFDTIKLDLSEAKTINDVLNEISTPSFFNDKKFLHVVEMDLNKDDVKLLIEKIEHFNGFILLCFKQNLDAKNAMRKLCEESNFISVISCFADEKEDIKNIVIKFLSNKKINIEQDAIMWIVQNFSENRGVLMNELEKLYLYKLTGIITLEDVKMVMDEECQSNLFNKINDFFMLDIKSFSSNLEILKFDFPPSALVSGLVNYAFKLISILEERDSTKQTFDTILNKKFIFFKQIPIMKTQLSKWNLTMLNNLLELLLDMDFEVKQNFHNGYNHILIELVNFINKK